jgi:hypothetical protein
MNRTMFVWMSVLMLGLPIASHADDEFYGKIESRPDGKTGSWVINGRTLEVTAETELEEGAGPMVAGACAEVEIDEGIVEEIETVKMSKCN